jgi:hypothetical protein
VLRKELTVIKNKSKLRGVKEGFPTIRPEISSKFTPERVKRVEKITREGVVPLFSDQKFQNEKRIAYFHLIDDQKDTLKTTNSPRLPSPCLTQLQSSIEDAHNLHKKRSITHQKPKFFLHPINSSLTNHPDASLEQPFENARYSVNEKRKKAVLRHLNNSAVNRLSPDTK